MTGVQTCALPISSIAGYYTVEISDALNSTTCPSYYSTVTVTQGSLPIANAGADQTVCASSPAVTLAGTMQFASGGIWTGGSGTYSPGNTFLNASYTPTSSEIMAGSVTLNLTSTGAGGSCTNSTDQVIINFSASINISIPAATINCYNGSTTLTANSAGGPAPFSYLWNNGSTSSSIITGQGNYSVVVTDAIGCTGTQSYTLTQPTALAVSMTASGATCNGSTNGSASVAVTGGTSAYSYSWSGPTVQTNSTAVNLAAGTYSVTVTDANGCVIIDNITLSEPTALTTASTVTSNYNGQNISCNGANDGTAEVTANGGTAPYSYSWNTAPIQLTASANNLDESTYTVTVSDANGCNATTTVSLTQPAIISASASITSDYNGQNISCNGASDGTAFATVNGGTAPYNYSWNTMPVQLSAAATGLNANTYTATVTDANGCTVWAGVGLTQPAILVSTLSITSDYNGQNISCNGANNGSATAATTGGTMPYVYNWSTSPTQTTSTALSLGAATYTVTTTDANGCPGSAVITLTEPAPLFSLAVVSSNYNGFNISCNGLSDASLDGTITGGTMPYQFLWSTGATVEDLTGLAAGTYSLNITDMNGCIDSAMVIITQPDPLIASITSLSSYNGFGISCFGGSNGSIDANATGGNAPYNYQWSNSSTAQDPSSLSAGSYTLVVTDSNSCSASVSATLVQPASLSAVIDSITNYNGYGVSCNLSADGSINTSVAGGVSPYTYLWNNAATTDDILSLTAGTYILGVEDMNGCLASADTILSEPATFNSSYTFTNPGCNGVANGAIDFSLAGGVSPYTFSWNTGASSEDLINIPIGTFNILFNDVNGCSGSYSMTLTEPLVLNNSITQQNILCYGGNNGLIDINIDGGTLPYTYSWSNGSSTQDITNLTQGLYYVTTTDAEGCSRNDTVVVTQPQPLFLDLTSPLLPNAFNISFYHGTDGAIDATVNGGVEPYTYSWSTNQSTEDLQNLPSGQYSVVVTDVNGCATAGNIKLLEPFNLAMPTGITPNGDGQNDMFTVKGIEAYPNNLLTIYNRWGNVVYTSENYLNEWRGKNTSDEQLPEGTYFAILEINGRSLTLNGYVEIRRK